MSVKMSDAAIAKRLWPIEGTYWKNLPGADRRGQITQFLRGRRVSVRWNRYKTPVSYSEGAALELLEEA